MADVIGPDYTVLGWKVATCTNVAATKSCAFYQLSAGCTDAAKFDSCRAGAAQSAISINNGANQLASMLTAVAGGVWSEKYGKRAVLVCGFIGIFWINFAFAFTESFSVVFLSNLWGGLIGGVLGAPINGLMADVLPTGADGKPTHPTRDWNLVCQAWSLPGIVFPLILGNAFTWFPSKRATYRWFFIITGLMQALMQLALIPLGWDHQAAADATAAKKREQQSSRGRKAAGYSPPIGARWCDRLCFRETICGLLASNERGDDGDDNHPDDDDDPATGTDQQDNRKGHHVDWGNGSKRTEGQPNGAGKTIQS
eukprot:COSAG05_NODE_3114_length_2313_cov_7.323383_2_plen_312_part_00